MKYTKWNILLFLGSYLLFSVSAYAKPAFIPFVIKVQTDNVESGESTNTFTIPTNQDLVYSYDVDCDDDGSYEITGQTGDATCTYLNHRDPPPRTIQIRGTFPHIYFNNSGDKLKIISVEQWGEVAWESMVSAFKGAKNLEVNATDIPDLSQVTSMSSMFYDIKGFAPDSDIGRWDVSNITDMSGLFLLTQFNQDIGSWNVSIVSNFGNMFGGNVIFNQDIGDWNMSSAQITTYMFQNTVQFDQNIGRWDVSNVMMMDRMFKGASNFNHYIGDWNVSKVMYMDDMFKQATQFNQDIGDWNTASLLLTDDMFKDADHFNQDLGDWNISKLGTMDGMFENITLSTSQYGDMLYAWAHQPDIVDDVILDGGESRYCDKGQEAKNILVGTYGGIYNWTIADNGKNCSFYFTSSNRLKVYSHQKSVGKIMMYSSYDNDITLNIIGGTDGNKFTIDATGNLNFIDMPDYDNPIDQNRDNIYRVQIRAYDAIDDLEDIQTVRVTVKEGLSIVPVITYLLQ